MTTHPKLSTATVVTITRTVKAFRERNEYGPKTIAQAVRDGDLTESSGTVSVTVRVASGEHEGANVYRDSSGTWRAQYDPILQHPNGARRA